MDIQKDIRTGRHCVYNIHLHLVFVTKYRKNVFHKEHIEALRELFTKICKDFEGELHEFDGEADHVHLLVTFHPKHSISKLVNSLKGVSSRRLRKIHPEAEKMYYKGVLWSPSYFAGTCGGAPLSIVKQYIESQETPH